VQGTSAISVTALTRADEAKAFAKAGAAKDATTKAALTSITNGASKLAISTPVLAKVMAPRSVERVAPPPPSATDSPSPSPTPLPDEDISYEEALRRKEEKELAEAKLLCSCALAQLVRHANMRLVWRTEMRVSVRSDSSRPKC